MMKRSLIHQSLSLGVQMNEGLLQGWQAEMWLGTIVRHQGAPKERTEVTSLCDKRTIHAF